MSDPLKPPKHKAPFVPHPIPRQEFSEDVFDNLLKQRGMPFDWYQASFCPCQIKALNQANPVCPFCEGSGYAYAKPCEIKAMLLSTGSNDQFMQLLGLYQPGQAFISTHSKNHLGIKDRLVAKLSEIVYKEILPVQDDVSLRLRYTPTKILRFTVFSGKSLRECRDFDVKDRDIIFHKGKAPKFDEFVSINYLHRPIWVVQGFPNLHRDELQEFKHPTPKLAQLPVRATVMLDFLQGKGGPGVPIGS